MSAETKTNNITKKKPTKKIPLKKNIPVKTQFDYQTYLDTVTSQPGVYQMLDGKAQIIYVGKAKNLKKRISSYFRPCGLTPKTQVMVSKIESIKLTLTHTEGEALLLESNLIKKNYPRYNILLRDDKSYPYIFISNQSQFPRISLHRGAHKKKGWYLGPYPSAHAVRASINLLQKMFLIRTCEEPTFNNRSRPCLQYQIKRCSAPCVLYISEKAYAKDINHALLFLQGKSQQIINELVMMMEQTAKKMHYEKAGIYRDQIKNLRKVTEKQHVSTDKGDMDIIACVTEAGQACVQIFYLRNGLNLGNRNFFPHLPEVVANEEILNAFIAQHYLKREAPSEIIVSDKVNEQMLLEKVLTENSKHTVKIRSKVRGERAKLIEMALNNAKNELKTKLISTAGIQTRFEALQHVLELNKLPKRLECFDVSHTQGEATVASCVVFTPEGANKTDYRRYNIKNITGGDDYAAMKQALQRRYRTNCKQISRKKSQTKTRKLPDILFIDGGKGQLKQAIEVFEELNINTVLLIGVAKGEGRKAGLEKLVFNDERADLYLSIESPALNLILQVRDEAHRFAISGHRAQRAKTRRTSVLEGISGLGAKRRQTLLKHFGGLQAIKQAGIEDLVKITGISKKIAQTIYNQFHCNN